jgi:hypothetical protein
MWTPWPQIESQAIERSNIYYIFLSPKAQTVLWLFRLRVVHVDPGLVTCHDVFKELHVITWTL